MSNDTDHEPSAAIRDPRAPIRGPLFLRRFVRQRAPQERCDMCGAGLADAHQHLVEPASRQIVCSCDPCAVLFSGQTAAKYKRIPRETRFLADFRLSDGQWEGLMVPISLAFFFHSTPDGRTVALYPSPAGPTESLLTLDAWGDIVGANPALQELEPDVEALLVNRVRPGAHEYYIVPIDECYKLVGLIRTRWRGLSGGTEVWEEITRFFGELREKSKAVNREP